LRSRHDSSRAERFGCAPPDRRDGAPAGSHPARPHLPSFPSMKAVRLCPTPTTPRSLLRRWSSRA